MLKTIKVQVDETEKCVAGVVAKLQQTVQNFAHIAILLYDIVILQCDNCSLLFISFMLSLVKLGFLLSTLLHNLVK